MSVFILTYGIIPGNQSTKKFKNMKTQESIPTLDDIIFEKRNKLYGAYELRKNYHKRLLKSLMFSVSTLLSVFLFSIVNRSDVVEEVFKPVKDSVIFADNFTIQQYQPPKKFMTPPASKPDEHAFVAVTDTAVIDKAVDTSSSVSSTGIEPGDSITGGSAGDTITSPFLPVTNKPRGMASVDKLPEFPGGINKFYAFLKKKLRYTMEAKNAKLNARLYVRFMIDEDGFVRNVTLENKIGYGLDEQVAGVLEESPRWVPGLVKNSAVKTEMILPVSFNLR